MKTKFTIALSVLIMTGMVWDYNNRSAVSFPDAAPAGNTGSPGDGQTCFTSCHGNNPGNGSGTEVTTVGHDIPVTGYVPGTTYNVSMEMTGGGSSFGFSLSAQNVGGTVLGTLISGSGTQLNGGGAYITQTSNVGSGSRTWGFQWMAPTSGSGPVTFYAASIFGNNGGGNTGDFQVLAENTVQEASGTGIPDLTGNELRVFPNPIVDRINMARSDVDEEIMVTLFSMDGKMVYGQPHQGELVTVDITPLDLHTGVYFLQLESKGDRTIEKLLVR